MAGEDLISYVFFSLGYTTGMCLLRLSVDFLKGKLTPIDAKVRSSSKGLKKLPKDAKERIKPFMEVCPLHLLSFPNF